MNQQTALFLANLSHRWLLLVLALPIMLTIAMLTAGAFQRIARTRANMIWLRTATVFRILFTTFLILSLPVLFISVIHLGCAALKAHDIQCLSNIKQLSVGELLYAQDYDDHFNLAKNWSEAITPDGANSEKYLKHTAINPFRCPAAESPASYGMNAALSSIVMEKINDSSDTVLLFDADAPIRSFAGGDVVVAWKRHRGMPNISFADGHARSTNSYHRKWIVWSPMDSRR